MVTLVSKRDFQNPMHPEKFLVQNFRRRQKWPAKMSLVPSLQEIKFPFPSPVDLICLDSKPLAMNTFKGLWFLNPTAHSQVLKYT